MRGIGRHLSEKEIQRTGITIEASKRGKLGGEEQLSSLRMLSNKVEDLD